MFLFYIARTNKNLIQTLKASLETHKKGYHVNHNHTPKIVHYKGYCFKSVVSCLNQVIFGNWYTNELTIFQLLYC